MNGSRVYTNILLLVIATFSLGQALPTIQPKEGEQRQGYEDGTFIEDSYLYESRDSLLFLNEFLLEPTFKDEYLAEIFDYHRKVPQKKEKEPDTTQNRSPIDFGILSNYALIVLYLLAFLLVGGLAYAFAKDTKGFTWRIKKRSYTTQELKNAGDLKHIGEINFIQEIEKAKKAKQWRAAVRLYYLFVLQRLQEKKWIQFQIDKTDTAYLSELEKKPIYDDFFKLLMNYFRIWYGKQEITNERFNTEEEAFKKLLKRLNA